MFDNTKFRIAYYSYAAKERVLESAHDTKEFVTEHKSEMTRTAAISTLVYVGARINGFKAGYEFAKNPIAV